MEQKDIISAFCGSAKFHMVKFESKNDIDYGKILTSDELLKLDLQQHEIHRSIDYKNDDVLFVYDLKPKEVNHIIVSSVELLIKNLEEARIIEEVYPNIFRWVYDGISLKAYAIVPSGNQQSHSTITRYGGTYNFIKILRQHLNNISTMSKGKTPNFNFLHTKGQPLEETEISIGSINRFNDTYSVGVNLNMTYIDIIRNSKNNVQNWQQLNILDMKFWMKEINPDFISEAKHIKLKKTMEIDETLESYPPCLKKLMNLPHKGNLNRFLLARFLLSVHSPKDAKYMYEYVMGEEEREHIKTGNCSSQWNYIRNNMKRYDCPTCIQMRLFCDENCKLAHPLEKIQEKIEGEKQNAE
jgi:hypothetical protein